MHGRVILTASAAILILLGSGALFAPEEVATMLGGAPSVGFAITLQILGGCFFGFAMHNWLSRLNRTGGIYARPICLANLLLFATAALAIWKNATSAGLPTVLVAIGVLFALFAIAFAWLIFVHDPASTGTGNA